MFGCEDMKNDDIWLLITSIILFWPCSKAGQEANVKAASFVDNAVLENAQSDVRMPFGSPPKRNVAMSSQSPVLSLTKEIALNNEDRAVTSLLTEASGVEELHESDNNRSVQSPSLSMKDILQTQSGVYTLSLGKDDSGALHEKIFRGYQKVENRRHDMSTETRHYTSWGAATGRKSHSKYSYLYKRDKTRLLQLLGYKGTRNVTKAKSRANLVTRLLPPVSRVSIHGSGSFQRMMKRDVRLPYDTRDAPDFSSIPVKDTDKENGTGKVEDYTTSEVTYPITPSPEAVEEEFVPGMSKSRFITAASTSLMLGLCFAVIIMYYIRRRRLRMMMSSERQKLIPFRISTGIYYNQTGLCF